VVSAENLPLSHRILGQECKKSKKEIFKLLGQAGGLSPNIERYDEKINLPLRIYIALNRV